MPNFFMSEGMEYFYALILHLPKMKSLCIYFTKPNLSFVLPVGMTGLEWKEFKRDYSHIIELRISEAKLEGKKSVSIDIEKLPALADNLDELKKFMSSAQNVLGWNTLREEAKMFFTAPCIYELDASGYIKKILK